mmetsp:Transcript_9350/g.24399  ORF Transcript_9350/g.24399 Transcript_9350/m.24399 type:complete len:89 (+) Transcript_9350:186-452(+)
MRTSSSSSDSSSAASYVLILGADARLDSIEPEAMQVSEAHAAAERQQAEAQQARAPPQPMRASDAKRLPPPQSDDKPHLGTMVFAISM